MDPVASAAGGGGYSYPDSVDSSPRSRGGESWDEPFPSSAAAASSKLRLMCSYGGRIVPRPTDKSLCYLGGETRIVVVDRLSSLADLHSKLSRSLLSSRPFTLKYQLPNEDLDSLISVTSDEDLDNMIEEYDRIAASFSSGSKPESAKSSRIRLFLFPTKPDSAPSSIGSLLDDSKSETWFVDALNGAMGIGIDGLPRGLSTDSTSVNCLLGLEDDSSVHSRGGVGSNAGGANGDQADPDRTVLPRPDSSGKLGRQGQDIHSVPDSPMLETNSSFGSTSSAPSLSNLPPIRVRPDDRLPDQRYGNMDEHFQQMNLGTNLQNQQQPLNSSPPPIPMPTGAASTPTISPTENPKPNRFGSDDDKPDARKQPPMPQQVVNQQQLSQPQQQMPAPPAEAPISDSRPVYYQERMPPAAVNPELRREIPVSDPATTYRVQQAPQAPVPVPETGYVMQQAIPAPEQQPHTAQPQGHPHAVYQQAQQQLQQQFQHAQQQQQFQHAQQQQQQFQHAQQQPQQQQQFQHAQQQPQQQQQFVSANPHYLQIPSYYQVPHPMQQAQQYDPSLPMYYFPVRQNPPQAVSAVPLPKMATKPEILPNLYRTTAPPAQMIHMAAPGTDQGHAAAYPGMGYHVVHHHHPSQAPPAAAAQPAAMMDYGYDYTNVNVNSAATTDMMQPGQMYYTQTTSPPVMSAQYQTVISEAAQPTVEVKQNRASS